jgi:hypothetical protein
MQSKIFFIITLFILPLCTLAQYKYPQNVQSAIEQTNNKAELQKALQYFYKTKDSLKIKSINFLVANMPIHNSKNYYWATANGNRISYNELDYSTFAIAVTAFEEIKKQNVGIHPVPYTYKDIDSIKADLLIENVEEAVKKYRNHKKYSSNELDENTFLEYILPYRTSIEPLQYWRKTYSLKFSELLKPTEVADTQMLRIGQNIKTWFTNTYKIENRGEPLPRLGALQLLSRAKGACEDIAGLAAFMVRSQGYAAAVDFVPAWATASGVHFLNYVNISATTKHHYDAADGYILDTLAREPAKVLRTTYSIQPQTIAALLKNDTTQIPNNFMRLQNYKDVTQEYWQTDNVSANLFKNDTIKCAYAAVWNLSSWRPVWYGLKNNNHTVFTNLCKGAVYLPIYYINNKLVPAGNAIINGYDSMQVLQPNLSSKRTIQLKEQPKYLAFRVGKKYRLFYWNNTWVNVGTQIPISETKELVFENVPLNALLLLVPEYTQGKDRPFIITEKGERFWY